MIGSATHNSTIVYFTYSACSIEESGDAGELNAGEESLSEFDVPSGDGPEMLECVEETLHKIAFEVGGEFALARGFSVCFGWDDWGEGSIVEGGDEGLRVEDLVGDQSAGIDGLDQRYGTSEIMILAWGEPYLDRIYLDQPSACNYLCFGSSSKISSSVWT
jgi:hypothetical protein